MKLTGFVLLALSVNALSPLAWPQSTTDGAVGGIVTDPSGAVVPNASVTARNTATNARAAEKTGEDGRYLLIHLQPGTYELGIEANGLATFKNPQVIVEVGRVTTVDATLGVAATTQTVEVSAEAPVVQTEQQDFSTNLNQTSIQNLPINGRRWFNFALTTPGTV